MFLFAIFNQLRGVFLSIFIPACALLMRSNGAVYMHKLRLPITTILLLLAWGFILLKKRMHFKEWCDDVFIRPQGFLLLFRKIGWNDEVSSLIICVISFTCGT